MTATNLGSVYLGGARPWPIVSLGLSGMRLQVHAQIIDNLTEGQTLEGCRIHGSDGTVIFTDPTFTHRLEENIDYADSKAPHTFQFGLLISKPPPPSELEIFDAEILEGDDFDLPHA